MTPIDIKRVSIHEVDQLQKIGKQTFWEAFAAQNTEADMAQYLSDSFSFDKLLTELSEPNSQFYFATVDDEAIGYLKLNFGQSQTELKNEKSLEIERIYVLEAFYGENVGQMLYEQAIKVAKTATVDYVWLGVWEENPRAIQFYKKNGFVAFDKHIFKLGNDEQTDIMMKLNLTSPT